jgi:hypothetical protein
VAAVHGQAASSRAVTSKASGLIRYAEHNAAEAVAECETRGGRGSAFSTEPLATWLAHLTDGMAVLICPVVRRGDRVKRASDLT